MSVDHIRYDLLVRDALRNVVRRVVADAAKNGLPGDHHFYVAFDTRVPGVRLSPRLREQYPEEMTIVLQHQFWDLQATEAGIEVGLAFGGIPEKLFVPFDALKGFFDPSVQFGLEFEPAHEAAAAAAAGQSAGDSSTTGPSDGAPVALPGPDKARAPAEGAAAAGDAAPGADDAPPAGAEVVRLDRFRKK